MYYVGNNGFSPEWIGVTGAQIDSRVHYAGGRSVECADAISPYPFSNRKAYGDGGILTSPLKHFTSNRIVTVSF